MQQKCITAKAPDAIAAVNEARGGFAYKNPLPGDGPTSGALIQRPQVAAPPPPPADSAAAPLSFGAPAEPPLLASSEQTIANVTARSAAAAPTSDSTARSPIGTVIEFPLGFGFPSDDDGASFEDTSAVEEAGWGEEDELAANPGVVLQDVQNTAARGGWSGVPVLAAAYAALVTVTLLLLR